LGAHQEPPEVAWGAWFVDCGASPGLVVVVDPLFVEPLVVDVVSLVVVLAVAL
jgi:hypothetical protein